MAARRALYVREICEFRQRVGQEVRKARKSAKLTQAEVARYLEWTRTTVVAIERGLQAVTIDQLVCLAILFRRGVCYFLPHPAMPPDDWLKLFGPSRSL